MSVTTSSGDDSDGNGPVNSDHFDPHEEWKNYGDVNPERHGGRFCRWTGSSWQLVQTRSTLDLPEGLTDHDQMVEKLMFEPQDVWAEPYHDETGFTRGMEWILEGFPEDLSPMDPYFLDNITYYVVDLANWMDSNRITEFRSDSYEDILDSYGVDYDLSE